MPKEKLIRDNVAGLALLKGDKLRTRVAKPEERLALLAAKLVEEAQGFATDLSLEELADVLTVIHAIAEEKGGGTLLDAYMRMKTKDEERGTFHYGVVLILED